MEVIHPALCVPAANGMESFMEADDLAMAIPQLSFGFGLKADELTEFALKRLQIPNVDTLRLSEDREDQELAQVMILKALSSHYKEVTGLEYMNVCLCKHDEFASVIELYDNYWLANNPNTIIERKQNKILDKMRRAFELPDDRQPMWFFQMSWYVTVIGYQVSLIIFAFELSSHYSCTSCIYPFSERCSSLYSFESLVDPFMY